MHLMRFSSFLVILHIPTSCYYYYYYYYYYYFFFYYIIAVVSSGLCLAPALPTALLNINITINYHSTNSGGDS